MGRVRKGKIKGILGRYSKLSVKEKKKVWIGLLIVVMAFWILISIFRSVFSRGEAFIGMKESPYEAANFYYEDGILKYEDSKYKSITGIDVSAYQGQIDWEKVKDAGVEFAYIRVGYRGWKTGAIAKDLFFEQNLEEAKKAGVKVGVYFFSQAISKEEAVEEADFVAGNIFGEKVKYPVVFDMERVNNEARVNALTVEEKTEIALTFCETIENYGYQAAYYGNPNWLTKYIDMEPLSKYSLWLAHYTENYDFPYIHRFWQYTDKGRIPGIDHGVDLNIEFVKKGFF